MDQSLSVLMSCDVQPASETIPFNMEDGEVDNVSILLFLPTKCNLLPKISMLLYLSGHFGHFDTNIVMVGYSEGS